MENNFRKTETNDIEKLTKLFENLTNINEQMNSCTTNNISNVNNFDLNQNFAKMSPFEFWQALNSPKYICAPMVDQSELAFRKVCRKYGTTLTYTPMVHSVIFTTAPKYREKVLQDISPEEQPCFIQFCGHDPDILLKACKIVEKKCPAIDINLGCPQGIAKRGNYGSFLLENEELVLKILSYLSNNLSCGVTCKIRLYKDLNRSYKLVKSLEVKVC